MMTIYGPLNSNPTTVIWICQDCDDRVPNVGDNRCRCGRVEVRGGRLLVMQQR